MSYFKRIKLLTAIIILFVVFITVIFMFSCDKNNIPDNSAEALQVFAAAQEETPPPTEIISGVMSFSKTENIEITENTEIIENTEVPEISSTEEEPTEITSEIESESETDGDENEENEENEEEENILYVITPSGKKYHYPTCRTVKNIKQYLTKDEAEQMGYDACKICNPE